MPTHAAPRKFWLVFIALAMLLQMLSAAAQPCVSMTQTNAPHDRHSLAEHTDARTAVHAVQTLSAQGDLNWDCCSALGHCSLAGCVLPPPTTLRDASMVFISVPQCGRDTQSLPLPPIDPRHRPPIFH